MGRFMLLDSPTDTISIYTLDGTELFMQPINTIDASDVLPSDVAWRESYGYTWSKDSPILQVSPFIPHGRRMHTTRVWTALCTE